MEIRKGIPLSSGLGGSAASAVAAVVAGNAFLKKPLLPTELVEKALEGEVIASRSRHADNVAPCLLGGFQLILGNRYFSLPLPKELFSVVVYPDLQVETKVARAILRSDVSLEVYIRNSARIAALMLALHQKLSDSTAELYRDILIDEAIEPQRQVLIKGFQEVKTAAIASRALGFSISGAGPSVFGWALSEKEAKKTAKAVKETWSRLGVSSQVWVGQLSKNAGGARVVREK
jgi:homoserine kinase